MAIDLYAMTMFLEVQLLMLKSSRKCTRKLLLNRNFTLFKINFKICTCFMLLFDKVLEKTHKLLVRLNKLLSTQVSFSFPDSYTDSLYFKCTKSRINKFILYTFCWSFHHCLHLQCYCELKL
jgi:hypothetical protein